MRFNAKILITAAATLLCSQCMAFNVARIEFHGASAFSKKELTAAMKISEDAGLDSAVLVERMKEVLKLYADEGYYFASIDSYCVAYSNEEVARIDIYIAEGARTKLSQVVISSADGFHPAVNFPAGKDFSIDAFNSGIEDALESAEEQGYPFVNLRLTDIQRVRTAGGDEISAGFSLEPGPQVKLAGVEASGNATVKSGYIVRESRLKTGAVFSPKSFSRAQRYLRNTSLFEQVALPEFVNRDDDYFVSIKVKEKRHNSIDGAVGYIPSGAGGGGYWTGLVDLAFMNLFGSGRRFVLHWQQPYRDSQDMSIQYREPWVGGFPVGISVAFKQSLRATSYYTNSTGEDKFLTRDAELTADYSLMENILVSAGVTHNEVFPDSLARYATGIPHSLSWGEKVALTIDTRDEPLNPRSGYYYYTSVQSANKKNYVPQVSEIPQTTQEKRMETDSEAALETFRGVVVHGKISIRSLQSGQKPLPVSELYYLGGASSLRGYREEQFMGTTVACSNLEIRWIMGKYSRLYVFNDWGYVENEGGEVVSGANADRWHTGYGFGAKIETAAGILGVEYGISPGTELMQGKIHIMIRNEF